jgi:PAS domain S-box-containing protein
MFYSFHASADVPIVTKPEPLTGSLLLQSEERFRLLVEGVRDYAIFMLDPNGTIISWNTGAERIKGYTAQEIIGKHFSIFYPPEKIESGFPQYELKVTREEGRFEDEGWRVRKNGQRFWANVVITALYDSTGALAGFAKVTRDMTERRAHEEQLRQSEERFRLLVERVKDYAIFLLDPTGHVASWNQGAERIKGYRADEIIGRHFSVFYPQERIDEGFPQHELEVAREVGRFEDEGWRVRKDGSTFWANVVITALFDDDGHHYGFAKVTRDMSERKRVEALELAERRMFEFLAMLSHELRNPLAPISNAVYMLQIKPIDDPEVKWVRDVLDRQVSQLTRLIDDLLEVSRVTSGNIPMQKSDVDLGAIVARAIETSRPTIDAREHALDVDVPSEPLVVHGDPLRLTQVVVNLLNNAAKYTPERGRISVAVRAEGPEAVVHVRDNGMGISHDLMPRIFDLFTQGERTLDRAEGGLGIGLTLVRRIVDLHGGTIEAISAGHGTGSEFIVRLARVVSVESEGSEGGVREPARGGPRSLRVLVVDDNVDAATSMMFFMRTWGYDVRVANDGESAIEAAASFRPDVVLLDIGLPRLDGYQVAERLRAMPSMSAVTLVAVTGYGQEEDRRRSREAGFSHHFVKPVDPDTLRTLMAEVDAAR